MTFRSCYFIKKLKRLFLKLNITLLDMYCGIFLFYLWELLHWMNAFDEVPWKQNYRLNRELPTHCVNLYIHQYVLYLPLVNAWMIHTRVRMKLDLKCELLRFMCLLLKNYRIDKQDQHPHPLPQRLRLKVHAWD